MKQILILTLSLLSSFLIGQDFYDLTTVQTIEITFAQSNWDQLLDDEKAGAGDYIMAQSVAINGVVLDSVGVKYKGNSSYNANQVKNPFHIELDTYKDHEYDGYTDIKLANGKGDPTFVRDVLGFQIIRQYMDAPLSNYANLYVNGTLIGLYTNTESISKKFADDRFGSKNNAFFDCSPPAGAGPTSNDFPNLVYLGQDSLDYYDAYGIKSDEGWQELIDLCDTLVNNTSDVEDILDVDRSLWMLAFDNVIVNLDSYIGAFRQNYYLYRSDFNQFFPVVWDLNESFGVFSSTGSSNLNSTAAKQQMDHLLHISDSDYPLIKELLADPMYKRMYLAHLKTILLENFDDGSYYTSSLAFQATIDASVQADVNKFFTYAEFISNLTTDLTSGGGGPGGGGPGGATTPGITNLMDGRNSYLLGLSDFTQTEPTISNIALSSATPTMNAAITITATITNETTVYLGHGEESKAAPFTRVQMFDDGAHNDGAANDGTYGVEIVLDYASTQYYIYAENATTGKFSPVRAEHEYYSIIAGPAISSIDYLVINEFMASNDLAVTDPAGEYEDWIELFNLSNSAVDLEGYFLSDDLGEVTQWTFPAGSIIPANGYLIIWADKDETQTGIHSNFKLSGSGEDLVFADPAGAIIDQISYVDQTEDISYGRYPNGTGTFQAMEPFTFNTENTLGSCEVSMAIAGAIASDTYTVSDIISSDGEISAIEDVTFQGSTICLDTGFTVDMGAVFLAEINPCVSVNPANEDATDDDK